MLGNYTRGMIVKIPAKFQDNNKNPVSVDNVVLRIEHYDNVANSVIQDLPECSMPRMNESDYLYEYEIPQNIKDGSYFIYISAKIPGNKNRVFEAVEQFNIVSDITKEVKELPEENKESEEYREPPVLSKSNLEPTQSGIANVEDIVVNEKNEPVSKVLIDFYLKANFNPISKENIKVGGTITDSRGKWHLTIPHGEYVIVYKAIGYKENREFRKI